MKKALFLALMLSGVITFAQDYKERVGINTTTPSATVNIKTINNSLTTKNFELENQNGSKLFTVLSTNGNVGIGKENPSEKLEVNGNILASGYVKSASLDLNSDKRLKNNITPVSTNDVTKKLLQLAPVTYYWNQEGKAKGGNDKLQYGLIAQEVENVFPNMVNTDEKGYKSVNYIQLIPLLLKALQEQQKEIQVLKSKIK